jgi:drug/metabolite transporter (DMT)-like permease
LLGGRTRDQRATAREKKAAEHARRIRRPLLEGKRSACEMPTQFDPEEPMPHAACMRAGRATCSFPRRDDHARLFPMRSPLATFLPLLAAFGYTFAALMLKRATECGVGPWRVTFLTNWAAALVFAPWWLSGGLPFSWENLGHALITGALFFVGQILTFLALSRGDVSLTTPVLGTKVLFVALLAIVFGSDRLTPSLWFAAALTTIATALLGTERRVDRARLWPSLVFGFAAAMCYASTDVLMQEWVKDWGFGHFAPVMFLSIAVFSFTLVPFFRAPISAMPPSSLRWAIVGGLTLGLQATGMAYSISVFREVTTTNILYNTRGIWSVIIVWAIGHWFANTEREHGTAVMLRRLFGALLLLGAVFLSLRR